MVSVFLLLLVVKYGGDEDFKDSLQSTPVRSVCLFDLQKIKFLYILNIH